VSVFIVEENKAFSQDSKKISFRASAVFTVNKTGPDQTRKRVGPVQSIINKNGPDGVMVILPACGARDPSSILGPGPQSQGDCYGF
tara:strand:+ start:58009 stop:58266 length:258 start_codon:yes stop_codon:yes gene_type:complete